MFLDNNPNNYPRKFKKNVLTIILLLTNNIQQFFRKLFDENFFFLFLENSEKLINRGD